PVGEGTSKLAITASGITLGSLQTIQMHEGKQTTTLRAGGLDLGGDHGATATLSTLNGASLGMSGGDKRVVSLSASDDQSTLSLGHGQAKLFIAASDTVTAVEATRGRGPGGLYVRSADGPDATVTARVDDKTVSLAATKTKADVDHVKH